MKWLQIIAAKLLTLTMTACTSHSASAGPKTNLIFLTAKRKFASVLCTSVLLVCGSFAAPFPAAASSANTIAFPNGTLHGFSANGVQHFLGIPYAQPPLGELRWQRAHPVEGIVGRIEATNFGPVCMQPANPYVSEDEMSEDCLTLNVWRPVNLDGPLPVMFWLHGGGFVSGNGRIPGEVLARHGVVVVSLNYRLGSLGFFAHDSLDSSVANFGLTDAISALDWVQKNISMFGGDSDNVTIFGNSAGGMMVNLLLVSSDAQTLFDKAISQSGYITWPIPTTKVKHQYRVLDFDGRAVPFAEDLGEGIVTSILSLQTTAQELRELDARKLVNVKSGFFRPVVDGITVQDQPYRLIGRISPKVPLITGGTSYEGSVMPFSGISIHEYRKSWCHREDFLREMYGDDFEADGERGYRRIFGDERYIFSSLYLGQQWSEREQSAWLYLIDLPQSQDQMGVSHGADYRLLFYPDTIENPVLKGVGEKLRQYWINFARKGDPNGESLPVWPRYNSSTSDWLVMGFDFTQQPLEGAMLNALEQRLLERQKLLSPMGCE